MLASKQAPEPVGQDRSQLLLAELVVGGREGLATLRADPSNMQLRLPAALLSAWKKPTAN